MVMRMIGRTSETRLGLPFWAMVHLRYLVLRARMKNSSAVECRHSTLTVRLRRNANAPAGNGLNLARRNPARLQERNRTRIDRRVREKDRQQERRKTTGVGDGNHQGARRSTRS